MIHGPNSTPDGLSRGTSFFYPSRNIFAMDLANILHAEDRFFCCAQKFFCYQTMFGTKHSLLYDV
jgi:hypothetical protein